MQFFRRILRVLLVLFILLNISAAFHAYKFTHFYPGIEAKKLTPENMSWWNKTKAMLVGVPFAKSVNTPAPDITYNTITLRTEDSVTLEAWYRVQPHPKGTVVLFHGHGASRSRILAEEQFMFRSGFNTLSVDFRAHGGSEGSVCTIGFNEAYDVKAAYDFVIKEGAKQVVLWGISLGAATISRAIYTFPSVKPSKVIMEMSFGSLEQAVKGRVRMMGLPEQPVAGLLTFWGGAEQGFWAFDHDPIEYVKKINCPVLFQWGVNDKRVTRAETETLFKNCSSSNKQLVEYKDSGHESLCKKESAKWEKTVRAFLWGQTIISE